ncbi:zinc-binding protein A33-like [Salminus brasiliensis]|uniref:zinc-binding protein A33-like n=1 Tax=Salminus brasiliensis TaxID=930266 RepID=UPI003B836790
MASSRSSLDQNLSCPVCLEVFKDPVILSCGHSFCRTCLQQTWTQSRERECPVCRRRPSREQPLPDVTLRNVCESYKLEQKERPGRRGSAPESARCALHCERLSLFCVDDETMVCVQCVSQDHQSHSFCSLSKAAGLHKETFLSHLTNLEKTLQDFRKVKDVRDLMAAHVKFQAKRTEQQIKEEFEMLHLFLRTEEEVRISALRKEEQEKSQMMKKSTEELEGQIEEISTRIRESEDKLKDDVLFLQDLKGATERAQYTAPNPKPDAGALIDVAKHLGNLRYRVWEKMKDLSPYFPVVLDPNTANACLSVSADLSSVSFSTENPQLPDNPERMSGYEGVLGPEGFSSGTHSWVVEVGESEDWIVGVAEESVSRKEGCMAVPENGFYCIWRWENEFAAATALNATEKIATSSAPKRIRVSFNWEEGQVTFSNADTNKDLYTFTHTFKKKVYPYFYNNSKNPLRVLPFQISTNASTSL